MFCSLVAGKDQIDYRTFFADLFRERTGRANTVFVFGEPIKKGLEALALRGRLNPALGPKMMFSF
jgi:hypothetical protein